MRTTSYLALSRQAALERQMATVANNLANATTTGYRAEHMVFEETLHRAGRQRVAFVQDVGLARDLSPGPVTQTGNPLDLAIAGEGYLAFATETGTGYGRAGRLEIAPDGRLVDSAGRSLLDDGGNAIVLATDESGLTVAADGTVSGRNGAIARIGVYGFANEQALRRAGDGLFTASAPAAPAEGARLVQGALEGSNVQPVLEMTTMLATVRAFEGAQRLLDTEHELERQAIERAGRGAG
jgi:flagellar basal-body rod protein FlgF